MTITVEDVAAKMKQLGLSHRADGDNTGWKIQQKPLEAAPFLMWCREQGVKNVLELGTGDGGFARFMQDGMRWNVTSVDIEDVPNHAGEFINASTIDAYPALYGREFDMVFIDAGHSYFGALRDYHMYQHMAPIVALHDIATYRRFDGQDVQWADDVRRVWSEISAEKNTLEFIDDDNPLGIGVILQKNRPRVNLSIVTGTHNRFGMLKRMIESVRAQIPVGITYEFVIVAQDCSDECMKWLHEQEDIELLEYPELIGGIRAFNIGCYYARGDYVLVANDDVEFHKFSIIKALSHLAGKPTCGMVAFAPHPPGRVKVMRAMLNGNNEAVYYGETCLVPKWMGDWADWWGGYSGMSSRLEGLYGGDNHLSSIIWQAGYSVDAVDGVSLDDHKPNDAIKQKHTPDKIRLDSEQYRRRFPRGPKLGNELRFGPRPRTLRILNMPIIANERSRASKHAERKALQNIGLVIELDFLNDSTKPSDLAHIWQPDLVFTQMHSPRGISPAELIAIRNAAPNTTIINRNFDAQEIKHFSPEMVALLNNVDLQLHKVGGYTERYDRLGIPAAYWIEGFEERIPNYNPDMPQHDIVIQMNIYRHREHLRQIIENLNNYDVGMYGTGWSQPTGNTHYDFTAGDELYKNSKIAISDTFPGTTAYMSRRVAQIMAAGGAICFLQYSPGLNEAIGFIDDETDPDNCHYVVWHNYDELLEKINYWMDGRREGRRQRMAERAAEFACEHLSCLATMYQLWFDILPEVLHD